jgi:hypothetical protein
MFPTFAPRTLLLLRRKGTFDQSMSEEPKKREGPTLGSTLSEPTTLSTNNKNREKTTKTIENPDKNKKTFENC